MGQSLISRIKMKRSSLSGLPSLSATIAMSIAAELNHQVGEAYAAPQGRLTIL